MKLEHWEGEDTGLLTSVENINKFKNDPVYQPQLEGLKFCCIIEAETFEECLDIYHKHVGDYD